MPNNYRGPSPKRTIYLLLMMALYACLSSGETLYFPRAQNDSQYVTGVAFSSNQGTSSSLAMTLFNAGGTNVASGTFSLAGNGQLVGTIKDLLNAPDGFTGWLRVDSTSSIAGMGILFDKQDAFISEAPSVRVPERPIYKNI